MNILVISYGDLDYDGRLRSLISVFNKMGRVYSYTRGSELVSEQGELHKGTYISFIKKAVSYASQIDNIDVLVLDNRKATIPGFFIRRKLKSAILIQDCRELYLFKEVKHVTGKIGCIFERKMASIADIVICANKERAQIMKEEYVLEQEPLTYENLRRLQYTSQIAKERAIEKLSEFINDGEIRIISSSGCSLNRTNDVLVKNIKYIEKKCRLFLVGSSSSSDEYVIRDLASRGDVNQVTILGQLNQDELKYLIEQCHIGIVNYGQYDTNNRLCASGKLYEFLYEGKPVVTTSNPPLKKICDAENIGIADDQYYTGINEIIEYYELFQNNVERYIKTHTIEANDNKLYSDIIEKIDMIKNYAFRME